MRGLVLFHVTVIVLATQSIREKGAAPAASEMIASQFKPLFEFLTWSPCHIYKPISLFSNFNIGYVPLFVEKIDTL